MIAAWMLYSLLVGVLLALAAWSAEGLLRLRGAPTRWVWTLALVGAAALTANAARGRLLAPPPAAPPALVATVSTDDAAAAPAQPGVLATLRDRVTAPVRHLLGGAERGAPPTIARLLLAAWLLAGAAAAFVHLQAYRRIGRARDAWPVVELDGERVRLAADVGPAVVGLARPEIVVPRWLLDRPAAERQLVLHHEREHLRAHDPLLLAAGCAAAVVLAWHPAVWWMLARLRLAVETDCDRRVLQAGTATRPYAALLIDLAGHRVGLPPGAPALAGRRTHLERRLLAMTARTTRYPLARGGALATLALAAALVACESRMPTAAEVEKMDVAAVEGRVLIDRSGTEYYVDGVKTTPEMARNLAPESIASVSVLKPKTRAGEPPSTASRIDITTKSGAAAGLGVKRAWIVDSLASSASTGASKSRTPDSFVIQAPRIVVRGMVSAPDSATGFISKSPAGEVPLFFIDGKRVAADAVAALAPERIESVEILKSDAATKQYGAEGRQGVVLVRTRGH
ncbi:MAG TPA: M56 family metallopeptidase [Gemmatimonadaceae bacterium]|nr:M56 family metallopeptidase [Gemmatimonadaceae bacterium]